MIHYIDEVQDLKGKRVLLRLDLNVPIADGKIENNYRIERAIQTIDFLREKEAKVIIIAHCEGKESATLLPMWHHLSGYFPVEFSLTYFTPEAIDKLLHLEDKGVLLFENLRINPGEKTNDPEFAKKLAQMADIYVNDAFGVCHREHASVVGVPEHLPHYAGLLIREEIENLSRVFNPEHPFVFVLGGAKFDTKLPLITKFLDKSDHFFVGGALANDVLKAKGLEVGTSLVSSGDFGLAEIAKNPKIVVPVDVTVTAPGRAVAFRNVENVLVDECVVDAGPRTVQELSHIIKNAKTVVWNGPLGNYEEGFKDKTEQLAEIIATATAEHGVQSIVGGGDTLASINTLGLEHKFSFISTGGGAMLDYLVDETLPGLEVLKK